MEIKQRAANMLCPIAVRFRIVTLNSSFIPLNDVVSKAAGRERWKKRGSTEEDGSHKE